MKIKNLFLTIVFALALASCDDAINIDPADEITDSNAITNIDQLQRAATGVYGSIGGSSFIAWSSYFTDECRKPSTNRGSGVQVHTWSINSSTDEVEGYYSSLYGTINSANTVLAKLDAVPAIKEGDQNIKNKIKAELLAIRAIAHFDLLRFYATSYTDANALAVPIINRVIVFEKLPRNTVGEVMSFVKTDLETAYSTLNEISDNSDVTRITPLAIQGIRARIAIYLKEYQEAITYATEVINAVPLLQTKLSNNVPILDKPDDYLNIWKDVNDAEIIYKLKRVSGDGTVGTIFQDTNGDILYNVSSDLYSKFQASDVRRRPGALVEAGSVANNLKVGKYSGTSANYGLADIKVLRVAEMYLILSEALALKSAPDLAESATTLNTLRASRRLTSTALPDLIFTSQTEAFDLILLERRRELAYEGHRFFDLKRFNLGVNRIPADVLLNPFAEDLPAGDYRFTLPFPQAAIFANNTLVQNPGYNN